MVADCLPGDPNLDVGFADKLEQSTPLSDSFWSVRRGQVAMIPTQIDIESFNARETSLCIWLGSFSGYPTFSNALNAGYTVRAVS